MYGCGCIRVCSDPLMFVFVNATATTEIVTYLHTLSLHDARPIFSRRPKKSGPLRLPCRRSGQASTGSGRTERDNLCGFVALCEPFTPPSPARDASIARRRGMAMLGRSEEHTSELQSLMRISYAVFCLKKKKTQITQVTSRVRL